MADLQSGLSLIIETLLLREGREKKNLLKFSIYIVK